MIRSSFIFAALLAVLLPLGASALPQVPAAETENRLERLLTQPTERIASLPVEPAGAPPSTATVESYEQLKEQILGLLPGDALEFVARSLVDRQVQVKLSSRKALFVFQLPLE